MALSERIRSLANQNGHTIASVERELGFSNGSIKNWDSKIPSADKLFKVADFFNVDARWLFNGDISDDVKKGDIHRKARSEPENRDQYDEMGTIVLNPDEYYLIQHLRQLPEREQGRIFGNIEAKAEMYSIKKESLASSHDSEFSDDMDNTLNKPSKKKVKTSSNRAVV